MTSRLESASALVGQLLFTPVLGRLDVDLDEPGREGLGFGITASSGGVGGFHLFDEVGGRQFIAIAPGGHHFMETPIGDYLIAWALPEEE